MRTTLRALAMALWVAPLGGALAQGAPAQGASPVQSLARFEGTTTTRVGARADSVRVDIRDWILAPGLRLSALEIPLRGLMIVELRGGTVTTVIDGRRVRRTPGEIWSVPAGSTMQIETGDDMATLQTTVVGG
ncbi:MAG TPA: hypothetical protein VJ812_01835 [Gemmatimonadaceae bacterium]|nr:hypothetical protein [Gemmatimonadaceae bacterium]